MSKLFNNGSHCYKATNAPDAHQDGLSKPAPSRNKSIEYCDDLPEEPVLLDYVISADSDESPFSALLWIDLRNAENKAKLTDRQRHIFELYVRGLTHSEISRLLNASRRTIRTTIDKCYEKLDGVEVGLITALVENTGWSGAREVLCQVAEELGISSRPEKPNAKV